MPGSKSCIILDIIKMCALFTCAVLLLRWDLTHPDPADAACIVEEIDLNVESRELAVMTCMRLQGHRNADEN